MENISLEKKFFIYVLELEGGKYYVGRTTNLLGRIDQHRGHCKKYAGAKWTQKYPVKKMIRVIETDNLFEEDMYTKMYMGMHGIDNVRGGSYVFDSITREQRRILDSELNTASLVCRSCGSPNHFTNKCEYRSRASDFQNNQREVISVVSLPVTLLNATTEGTKNTILPLGEHQRHLQPVAPASSTLVPNGPLVPTGPTSLVPNIINNNTYNESPQGAIAPSPLSQ